MRSLTKLNRRVRTKKKAKVVNQDELLVQHKPVPIMLEEYMPKEWLRMVEENEDEEEAVNSCNVIGV